MTKSIEFTEDAERVISAMRDRVAVIGAYFGDNSPEQAAAATSLTFALANMIRLGGKVTKDGELSLLCWNDHITYGVNFHRKFREATEDEFDGKHLLGTWSVNS
jgi:hypothetical protein